MVSPIRADDRPDLTELERQLLEREAELARVQRIGRVGGVEVDLRGGRFVNKRSPEYLVVHGLPPEAATESHESWLARIHPDDRARMERHFLGAVAGDTVDYTAEYRVVRPSDGEVRWIFAQGQIERGPGGEPLRFVGAHTDITERRLLEERAELIAREFSHRIKNYAAVVKAMVSLTVRSHPEARAFAADLAGRLDALALAKDLVRPARRDRPESGSLIGLIDTILAPYRSGDIAIDITAPELAIGPEAGTALALMLHELATNALKYGALSVAGGRVAVAVAAEDGTVTLSWREAGGPEVEGPPAQQGFGTTLSDRTAARQLGGIVRRQWNPEGLAFSIAIPAERLAD